MGGGGISYDSVGCFVDMKLISVQLRHGIRFQQRKAMNIIIEIFMTC